MSRPVRPRPLQSDGDPPIAQPVQAALPERRTAEVLAEALEALAIARLDVHGRMEVEAAVVRVERHVALDPRRIGVGADPLGTTARALAEGGPAEDRRPRQAEALEPPPYPRDDAAHVVVRGRRRRMEAQPAVPLAHEDAVEDERVKVEVHVHGSAEALHARHHAGLAARQPPTPGLAAIRAAERAHEDVQDGATQPMIVGQAVAEPVRDRA